MILFLKLINVSLFVVRLFETIKKSMDSYRKLILNNIIESNVTF